MKKIIVVKMFLMLFLITNAQSEADKNCRKVEEKTENQNIRDEVEKRVKEVYFSKVVPDSTKQKLKTEYTKLQKDYNKVFTEIKNDIAGGYMFVGEGKLCKTPYYDKLELLSKRADKFLNEFDLTSNDKNKKSSDVVDVAIKVFRFFIKVAEEILEPLAVRRAEKFYNQVAWKDFDEIVKQ